MNYYNDIDKGACAWTQELINAKLIPDGHVDCRSITDITANDIKGYDQHHWFNGISGWAYALQLAGYSHIKNAWFASLPCQPFSVAGEGRGTDDERHLFPVFFNLVQECRPSIIFGEQVASKLALGWLDGVFSNLEDEGYACGALDLCAAGVGAPHIRQRLCWVADSEGQRESAVRSSAREGLLLRDGCCEDDGMAHTEGAGPPCRGAGAILTEPSCGGSDSGVADSERSEWGTQLPRHERDRPDAGRNQASGGTGACCEDDRMADPHSGRCQQRNTDIGTVSEPDTDFAAGGLGHAFCAGPQGHAGDGNDRGEPGRLGALAPRSASAPGSAWDNFDLLPCRDGKSRRVESGVEPLAYGVPGRVGLLRGYGNAIVAPLLAEFIKAYFSKDFLAR